MGRVKLRVEASCPVILMGVLNKPRQKCNKRYEGMQTSIHMHIPYKHTCGGKMKRLPLVPDHKRMHVKERKLKPVKEERDTGNCTSMSSIS